MTTPAPRQRADVVPSRYRGHWLVEDGPGWRLRAACGCGWQSEHVVGLDDKAAELELREHRCESGAERRGR